MDTTITRDKREQGAWNDAEAYVEPAPERRRGADHDGGIRMLGILVLLAIQAVIWFEIGYFVCKWAN